MIVSVSRRTDIPAFYSEWFFNRINEGFALVRNPMNHSQIRTVSLKPEDVDCIVFWTKNPRSIIPYLDKLNRYHFYFQFTLTPYGQDIEPGLPDKTEIMDTFKRLSDKLGAHRVIWRYDPILLNEQYTVSFHVEHFGKMAHTLKGYTEKATISFIDFYSKIEQNMSKLKIEKINSEIKNDLAQQLAAIAHENSLAIDACAEDIDLSPYGITRARCIDGGLIEKTTGHPVDAPKDKSQRPECGCAASVDIGAYNTCRHGCLYCYANNNQSVVLKNMEAHNKLSPLLVGE
jgi:DNA repair photolyase